jgi:hexosaminidase
MNSNVFTSPLRIENNTILKAVAFRGNERSKELTEQINFSKATTKPIIELQPINEQYNYFGVTTLVDGLKGNENFRSGRSIAWKDNDLEVLIDLKNSTTINEIAINTNVLKRSWLFGARSMNIFISDDGAKFQLLAEDFYKPMLETDRNGIFEYKLNFPETKARFVKLKVATEKMLPSWHTGSGRSAFLFVDEITLK